MLRLRCCRGACGCSRNWLAGMTKTARALITLEDTQRLASELAGDLRPGVTVGLIGPLGAGKTTFVRFLVEALGGKASDVASPSFALQHEYSVGGGRTVEHWDLYRLSRVPEELMEPPEGVGIRLVEWADRFPEVMAGVEWVVLLEVDDEGGRSGVVETRE